MACSQWSASADDDGPSRTGRTVARAGALHLAGRLGPPPTADRAEDALADLFQKSPPTINEHIQNIFSEGELPPEATIRKFRIVQAEGSRTVERLVDHYSLDVVIAVGYRVRSARGTQFRQWATATLREYVTKGFAIDDERLMAGRSVGADYFDELLERIRAIRASERRFYQKITDIYATSIDYDKDGPSARRARVRQA